MGTYSWSQGIATGGNAAAYRTITLKGTQITNDNNLTSTITVDSIEVYSTGADGIKFYLDGYIYLNGVQVFESTSSERNNYMTMSAGNTVSFSLPYAPVTINHSANGSASFTVEMAPKTWSGFFWVNNSHTSSQWKAEEGNVYTVTATPITVYKTVLYNANGGSGSMGPYSIVYNKSHTVLSNSFTAPKSDEATYTITLKPNYSGVSDSYKTVTNTTPKVFNNWRQGSVSGTVRKPGDVISNITSNITLYASWANGTTEKGTAILGSLTRQNGEISGYKVNFDSQGGNSIASKTSTRTITYTHEGWMSSENGTSIEYNKTSSYSFTNNVTLYAKWKENYINNSITLPNAPIKAGYKFLGWGTTIDATEYKQPGESITPTAEITYYAIWKANGAVRIYIDGQGYKMAQVYLFTTSDNKWHLTIPYLYDNSWHISS